MTGIPAFETARLIVRPVREADLPFWYKNFNDYEIIRFLSASVPWPYSRTMHRGHWEGIKAKLGKTYWHWGLFLKETPDDMIGGIDLWREGTPEHRGFWLAHKHHGKGLMTEAVRPVNDYAFEVLGFDTLILSNALGNTQSRRIKEKTGAKLLRTEPFKFVDPALTEHEVWELTAKGWMAFKAASGAVSNPYQSHDALPPRPRAGRSPQSGRSP